MFRSTQVYGRPCSPSSANALCMIDVPATTTTETALLQSLPSAGSIRIEAVMVTRPSLLWHPSSGTACVCKLWAFPTRCEVVVYKLLTQVRPAGHHSTLLNLTHNSQIYTPFVMDSQYFREFSWIIISCLFGPGHLIFSFAYISFLEHVFSVRMKKNKNIRVLPWYIFLQ